VIPHISGGSKLQDAFGLVIDYPGIAVRPALDRMEL
jgi:hypothetical protein